MWDVSDPVSTASGIIDKKARNLEKRKVLCVYVLVLCVQEPLFRAGHFYEQDTLCIIVLMELPPSHTHTHMHTHTQTLSVSHSHTAIHPLLSPPHTRTHTHTLRHTHAHTNFLCFSLTHCHHLPTSSLSETHTPSHTCTHKLSLFLTHTLPSPPYPPPSLKHTQNKLMALKETVDTGAQLDKDQQEAVTRLDEVTIQLELVRDLQKQFATAIVDVSVLLKVYWKRLLSIVVKITEYCEITEIRVL